MSQPLISCIIPTYNGEQYLADALESIVAQTYRPIEILLADDGSSDATVEIAARFREPVRIVRQANAGPAAARNLGLRHARGGFVAFLDQDDTWHPEKLRRQMSRFEVRPDLDLSVAHVQRFWTESLRHQAEEYRHHRLSDALPGFITGTLVARREVFDRVGPFNPAMRYGDAMEWFLRATEHGATLELLPDVLLRHRMHGGNLSQTEPRGSRDEFLLIIKRTLDRKRAAVRD